MEKELAHLESVLDKQTFILDELIKSEEIQVHSQEKIEEKLNEMHKAIDKMQLEYCKPSNLRTIEWELSALRTAIEKIKIPAKIEIPMPEHYVFIKQALKEIRISGIAFAVFQVLVLICLAFKIAH